jgi:hypothetical protein
MMTTTLRIDKLSFFIDAAQDTDQLRADVLAGSRESGYVHFAAHGHGDVSVLMSPGMSAHFEVRDSALDLPVEFESVPPAGAFDFWPSDLG